MSVIIRLNRLPWEAKAADIRHFFIGLTIPEGGVHIIGGDEGEAFMAFASDEDARLAMMRNGQPILGAPVQLFLSSKAEMQVKIAQARGHSMGGGSALAQQMMHATPNFASTNPIRPPAPAVASVGMLLGANMAARPAPMRVNNVHLQALRSQLESQNIVPSAGENAHYGGQKSYPTNDIATLNRFGIQTAPMHAMNGQAMGFKGDDRAMGMGNHLHHHQQQQQQHHEYESRNRMPPSQQQQQQAMMNRDDRFLEVRNFPAEITYRQVRLHFKGVQISNSGVKLIKGGSNTLAYIELVSSQDMSMALSFDGRLIDNYRIQVQACSKGEFLNAVDTYMSRKSGPGGDRGGGDRGGGDRSEMGYSPPPMGGGGGGGMNSMGGGGSNGTRRAASPRHRSPSPEGNVTDTCAEVKNLPSRFEKPDVRSLFAESRICRERGIFVAFDEKGRCMGTAWVDFEGVADCRRAVRLNGSKVGGRRIDVTAISRAELERRVQKHKDMITAKNRNDRERGGSDRGSDRERSPERRGSKRRGSMASDSGGDGSAKQTGHSAHLHSGFVIRNPQPDATSAEIEQYFRELDVDVNEYYLVYDEGDGLQEVYVQMRSPVDVELVKTRRAMIRDQGMMLMAMAIEEIDGQLRKLEEQRMRIVKTQPRRRVSRSPESRSSNEASRKSGLLPEKRRREGGVDEVRHNVGKVLLPTPPVNVPGASFFEPPRGRFDEPPPAGRSPLNNFDDARPPFKHVDDQSPRDPRLAARNADMPPVQDPRVFRNQDNLPPPRDPRVGGSSPRDPLLSPNGQAASDSWSGAVGWNDQSQQDLPPLPPLPPDLQHFQGGLVVGQNLPLDITRELVFDFFRVYQPIFDSIKVHQDPQGRPTGIVIFACERPELAYECVQELNGASIQNRQIWLQQH